MVPYAFTLKILIFDFAVNIAVRRIQLLQDKGKFAMVGHYHT